MAYDHDQIGEHLFAALSSGQPIAPLSDTYPDLNIDDAYAISRAFLKTRLHTNGEHVIGKKIGVTSKAVQDMLGVYQPDFGFLTNAMLATVGKVYMDAHIAPRAEAEIAFVLNADLIGPGIDGDDVLAATDYIQPCFEIVDSRIRDWKIKIEDTIADNASCGVFALGAEKIDPSGLDLAGLRVVVEKNGKVISEGEGSAVQGAPHNAVAWLANTLGAYDIPLKAGEVILSGSLVPLEPVKAGDEMLMSLVGLGACAVEFV